MVPHVMTVASRGLTPPQRKSYETQRSLTHATLVRYDQITQTKLAETIGRSQGLVSNVLNGKVTSLPVLEDITRVIAMMVSAEDRHRLTAQLKQTVALLRDHRPRPPRARPPK